MERAIERRLGDAHRRKPPGELRDLGVCEPIKRILVLGRAHGRRGRRRRNRRDDDIGCPQFSACTFDWLIQGDPPSCVAKSGGQLWQNLGGKRPSPH